MHAPRLTPDAIVQTYWPILACSFLVSLAVTPICRWYALRANLVDRPDDLLKPHKKPIPYLGGVAIFLGWVAGITLALVLFDTKTEDADVVRTAPSMDLVMTAGILTAGLGVMLLGLFDDLRLTSPRAKLIGVSLMTVVLLLVGVGDNSILIVLRSAGAKIDAFPQWLVWVYSVPIALFVTVGACNATNLIDGLDGLCSGVLAIIAVGFLILAAHLHLWGGWHPLNTQRTVLSLAMMGAALGFLPYNRNPAKIFMGDCGSMLLGINGAILLLLFAKSNAVRWMMASVMVFGLPIGDMLLTLVRRWRNQKPLMRGDRSHFYDQLVDRGWPIRRVVAVSYGCSTLFVLVGAAAIVLRTRYIVLVYGAVLVGAVWLVAKFKMIRLERPSASDEANGPQDH